MFAHTYEPESRFGFFKFIFFLPNLNFQHSSEAKAAGVFEKKQDETFIDFSLLLATIFQRKRPKQRWDQSWHFDEQNQRLLLRR
jgi:hypothetical protein